MEGTMLLLPGDGMQGYGEILVDSVIVDPG